MKVLLWKIGALGDVVRTTPLVRQLRRNLPDAQIDYLVGSSFRAVLEGNPHLDRVLDFDEGILLHARPGGLVAILAQLRGYDLVYVLDKHWIFGWLAWLARVPRRIGFRRRAHEGWPHTARVAYGPLRHEIQYYLDLAEAAGLRVDRDDVRLELPAPQPHALPGPYVVASNSGGANPGEASVVRQLPPELFAELVAQLAATQQVVFVGSAAERAAYEPLARAHGAINLCGTIALPQVWSVLAGAAAVYTTDNGLMHMAGAAGARVVAVFGPTHPLRKAPPGARWVWAAEDRYDPRYELFGRRPQGRFFDRLSAAAILQQAAPAVSAATAVAKT
jgi:ADP-heptose:LPS heptosyltransferase